MNIIINVYETYKKVVNNYKNDYTFEVNKNKIEHIKNFLIIDYKIIFLILEQYLMMD